MLVRTVEDQTHAHSSFTEEDENQLRKMNQMYGRVRWLVVSYGIDFVEESRSW